MFVFNFADHTYTDRECSKQRQSKLNRWGRVVMKLSCLGTLALILAYLVVDESFAHIYGSDVVYCNRKPQLPQHITGADNFSLPCFSKHTTAAFLEVPLMVAVVTLSIPIVPLIQYCVGSMILSYFTNALKCEGTLEVIVCLV